MVVAMSFTTKSTPLQKVLGFDAAEETYDQLDFREQIIIDLRIAGWSQEEIGCALGLSQGWISIIFRQIRFKLAEGNLHKTLELRQFYRENHPLVMDEPKAEDEYETEN